MDEEIEQERLELFEKAAEELELRGHEAEVRKGYSGRGMYGRETCAIVTDAPPALIGFAIAFAWEAQGHELINLEEDMLPDRSDSMGLSTVYY